MGVTHDEMVKGALTAIRSTLFFIQLDSSWFSSVAFRSPTLSFSFVTLSSSSFFVLISL
jgi:hypothetical protein